MLSAVDEVHPRAARAGGVQGCKHLRMGMQDSSLDDATATDRDDAYDEQHGCPTAEAVEEGRVRRGRYWALPRDRLRLRPSARQGWPLAPFL